MNALTLSMRRDALRIGLTVAFAAGMLAVFGSRAEAAPLPQDITISATKVTTIPYDTATRSPVQKVTVTAHVTTTLDSLAGKSGVTQLRDDVLEAARKVCTMADPFDTDDGECVREAVRGAQPQVEALIARARSTRG